MMSGMKVALCPLRRNVVSANAARPNGAGSATAVAYRAGAAGRSSTTAMIPSPFPGSAVTTQPGRGRNNSECDSKGGWATCVASRRQVVGIVGDDFVAVLSDHDEILEAKAAEPGAIETGLDRDHVAGDEIVTEPAE